MPLITLGSIGMAPTSLRGYACKYVIQEALNANRMIAIRRFTNRLRTRIRHD